MEKKMAHGFQFWSVNPIFFWQSFDNFRDFKNMHDGRSIMLFFGAYVYCMC